MVVLEACTVNLAVLFVRVRNPWRRYARGHTQVYFMRNTITFRAATRRLAYGCFLQGIVFLVIVGLGH